MTQEWTWWWGEGTEPEDYYNATNREDAIAQARESALENDIEEGDFMQMTICEGKLYPLSDRIFNARNTCEEWDDHNTEATGANGEGCIGKCTPEQGKELEQALEVVFSEWRVKHNLGYAYSVTTRAEEIIEVAAEAEE